MATFYLDYEGGNDANAGTSFALRWKTFALGATAARIAPGDIIRVMGSPNPVSLGINATWTKKNATVTLASALNALVTNCDSVWTASANVTSTADTVVYRTSTGSAKHVIAAGFTTGLAAYFATGTLDLSAYQGLTLWVYVTVKTLAAGELSIRLCSDVAGVTTVNTLALPAITQLSQWVPVYIDNGAALGASIASVALYGDTDNGAITVNLDNISTTKAAGNDCLTLHSLIGKNTSEEPYWAIRGINGTALTLDVAPSMATSTVHRGYYGTTETVLTYKRETIRTDLVATSGNVNEVMDSGTLGNPITFSGGWDRTDMTTQTFETWFDGQSGVGRGIFGATKSYIKFERLHLTRYNQGYYIDGTGNEWSGTIYVSHFSAAALFGSSCVSYVVGTLIASCGSDSALGGTIYQKLSLTKIVAKSCGQASINPCLNLMATGECSYGTVESYNGVWNGVTHPAGFHGLRIDTLITRDHGVDGVRLVDATNVVIGSIESTDNGGDAVTLGQLYGAYIGSILGTNSAAGFGLDISQYHGDIVIGSLTTSGNSFGAAVGPYTGRMRVLKSSIAEATKISPGGGAYGASGHLSFQNFNGVVDDHRGYFALSMATYQSESTVRHTASGIAWKLNPLNTTYISATNPILLPIATIAVKASVLTTAKIWMRRSNIGIAGSWICRGGQLNGVGSPGVNVTASISAAIDTWQELTLSFTPTVAGVVELHVECYGGTTYSLYVDDLTVT